MSILAGDPGDWRSLPVHRPLLEAFVSGWAAAGMRVEHPVGSGRVGFLACPRHLGSAGQRIAHRFGYTLGRFRRPLL